VWFFLSVIFLKLHELHFKISTNIDVCQGILIIGKHDQVVGIKPLHVIEFFNLYSLFKADVKANSDVKHAKSELAAENKKKKTLEKSLTDVRIFTVYFISYCKNNNLCYI
jgi:hypothetical protein